MRRTEAHRGFIELPLLIALALVALGAALVVAWVTDDRQTTVAAGGFGTAVGTVVVVLLTWLAWRDSHEAAGWLAFASLLFASVLALRHQTAAHADTWLIVLAFALGVVGVAALAVMAILQRRRSSVPNVLAERFPKAWVREYGGVQFALIRFAVVDSPDHDVIMEVALQNCVDRPRTVRLFVEEDRALFGDRGLLMMPSRTTFALGPLEVGVATLPISAMERGVRRTRGLYFNMIAKGPRGRRLRTWRAESFWPRSRLVAGLLAGMQKQKGSGSQLEIDLGRVSDRPMPSIVRTESEWSVISRWETAEDGVPVPLTGPGLTAVAASLLVVAPGIVWLTSGRKALEHMGRATSAAAIRPLLASENTPPKSFDAALKPNQLKQRYKCDDVLDAVVDGNRVRALSYREGESNWRLAFYKPDSNQFQLDSNIVLDGFDRPTVYEPDRHISARHREMGAMFTFVTSNGHIAPSFDGVATGARAGLDAGSVGAR